MSSRESGSRVDARTHPPGPGLADVVETYWSTRWDLRGQEPHRFEMLVDPCVTIAFEAGASRVVGVSTRLFRRELADAGLIRAVRLRAGAVRAVLPVASARGLTDRVVPLGELVEGPAIEAAVLGAADDEAAFARLDAWLAARVGRPLPDGVEAALRALAAIAADPGVTTVRAAAAAAGWSERALQRLFRDEVGMSPKQAIRRARLQEAAARLERGEPTSLAVLARALGYSDQAHLTRDFRAATGRTPAAFRRTV
ncbi:MAG: helix-turn-helix transcriptional regulator [Thermoleophilia bacterium]